MGNGDTSSDAAPTGDAGVATGTGQTLALAARYRLVVTVRDRVGLPLDRGRVTVITDGEAQPERVSDATGLIEPFDVAPRHNVIVRATFPTPPSDADPVPGSFTIEPHELTLTPADLQQRAQPVAGGPGLPTFSDTEGVQGVVCLTMRPIARYALLHLFPWQNRVLRELMYNKRPGDTVDAGAAASGAPVDPDDPDAQKDRKQGLRRFVERFGKRVGGTPPFEGFLREQRGHSTTDPTIREIDALRASPEELDRRIARIDARIAALNAELSPKPKPGKGSKSSPPPPSTPPPAPAAPDVAAGENDLPSPDPKSKAIRTDKPSNEREDLKKRRAELVAQRDSVPKRVASTAFTGLTHRELLVYIYDHIFAKDPSGQVIPPWVRHAILQYTGLRYEGAHHSHYRSEWIVHSICRSEIEKLFQGGGPPDDRAAIHLQELLALLQSDPETKKGVEVRFTPCETKPGKNNKAPAPPVAGAPGYLPSGKKDPIAALSAAVKNLGNNKADEAKRTIRTVLRALAGYWASAMDAAEPSRDALAPPKPGVASSPIQPIREAWGLLVWYRDTAKLVPESPDKQQQAWKAVAQYTELRNDFVNIPYVDYPPPPPPPQKGKPAPPPPPEPAVPGGMRWPVFVPSTKGSARGENNSIKDRLFASGADIHCWKDKQLQDLSVVATRAKCNQIAEMLAAARGMSLMGGIRGDAAYQFEDAEGVRATVAGHAEGSRLEAMMMERPSIRHLVKDAGKLFRPATRDDIRRGDLMFFLKWRHLGKADEDISNLVSSRTPMEFRLAVFNESDKFPKPTAPSPPDPRTIVIVPGSLPKVGESELARGVEDLPTHSTTWRDEQQIALANNKMLVRRHPKVDKYHQVLVWSHMATVIDVPPGVGGLFTFETNIHATGISDRSWLDHGAPPWYALYAHPPVEEGEVLPYLEYYLDRANVVDEARLPPSEDA